MNMTNLKSGNGYVDRDSMFHRMLRFRPPAGDHFIMAKIRGSDFSHIGILAYGEVVMPLFKIYTGNEELYAYIQGLFHEIAKDIACEAKSYKWKENDADDSSSAKVAE